MYVFPATRYGYAYLPNPVKRALRRALVQERDLAMTAAAVSHEFESRP